MAVGDLAAVGDNCIDRFMPPANEWLVGGNAVNVAVQLALLGRRVHYFGAVGGDAAGIAVRGALQAHAVSTEYLQVMANRRTAYTDIELDDDGERRFAFEEFGACWDYRPSGSDIMALRTMRHVHIGWLNDQGATRRALAGCGASISQDLAVNNAPENLDPAGLDLAFCSGVPEEARDKIGALVANGAKLAVMTLGAAGSLAFDGSRWLKTAAPPLTPEDTTGAGDAFIAGFIDAYVANASLERCLEFATGQAAAACMYRGGFPQLPLAPIPEPKDNSILTDL